ncbi:uncharacterized protein MELLADRAFT_68077 [Melampsora larici-populina 98AG31]|uniref:Uncharacterized protein n=1 Tax=Melampsora larici-populina (strain 98AG31 / pathotype 3-4-7) TaxID=747676 RepID=F4S5H7_MELLP|nr:uncharacterized protein MELLADRAFT_68077 [Melampsora larici-populina 98AG31]EGG00106.1 hypothetical protein MELLADRAFT_68077 [Melampsora larici-populina 98AG31]
MPPSQRKSETHRVICRCQSHECYRGRILDAYGKPQPGVEVNRATFAAHQLSDQKSKATQGHPRPTEDAQVTLSQSFRQLGLNASQSSPSGSGNQLPESHNHRSEPQTEDISTIEPESTVDSGSTKICSLADGLKDAGVIVYDCSKTFQVLKYGLYAIGYDQS